MSGDVEGLTVMHVGGPVADLRAAMADYTRLGAGPWVVSEPITFYTYDADQAGIVEQPLRLAFGRLPGGSSIELIEPQRAPQNGAVIHAGRDTGPPQARLLAARNGLSHIAYWCDEIELVGGELIRGGGRLLTASTSSTTAARWAQRLADGGPVALLPELASAYFELSSGGIVELVSPALWESALAEFMGGSVNGIIPAPPA